MALQSVVAFLNPVGSTGAAVTAASIGTIAVPVLTVVAFNKLTDWWVNKRFDTLEIVSVYFNGAWQYAQYLFKAEWKAKVGLRQGTCHKVRFIDSPDQEEFIHDGLVRKLNTNDLPDRYLPNQAVVADAVAAAFRSN